MSWWNEKHHPQTIQPFSIPIFFRYRLAQGKEKKEKKASIPHPSDSHADRLTINAMSKTGSLSEARSEVPGAGDKVRQPGLITTTMWARSMARIGVVSIEERRQILQQSRPGFRPCPSCAQRIGPFGSPHSIEAIVRLDRRGSCCPYRQDEDGPHAGGWVFYDRCFSHRTGPIVEKGVLHHLHRFPF